MAEAMKNKYYNFYTLSELARRVNAVYHPFPSGDFVGDVMDENWEALGLKARMRRITLVLGKYLPKDYERALGIIDDVLAGYPQGYHDNALVYFPDFVEVYGRDERFWQMSVAALARYTRYSTSEFAVRPFILKNTERMMRQMAVWAEHDNEHVRRLASEGCRPQLPWGAGSAVFQKRPVAGHCRFGAAESRSLALCP